MPKLHELGYVDGLSKMLFETSFKFLSFYKTLRSGNT